VAFYQKDIGFPIFSSITEQTFEPDVHGYQSVCAYPRWDPQLDEQKNQKFKNGLKQNLDPVNLFGNLPNELSFAFLGAALRCFCCPETYVPNYIGRWKHTNECLARPKRKKMKGKQPQFKDFANVNDFSAAIAKWVVGQLSLFSIYILYFILQRFLFFRCNSTT